MYALVTTAGVAQAHCPNEASPGFRAYLPDCRGYELVSPSYKEDYGVGVPAFGEEIGEGAPKLLISSLGAFSGIEDQSALGAPYEVERTATGDWGSTPLDAPFSTFTSYFVEASSPDLAHSLWFASKSDELRNKDVYLRSPGPDGAVFASIGPGEPPGGHELALNFAGASSDLSHAVFQVFAPENGEPGRLWPGDTTVGEFQRSLYEYVGTGNLEPMLVGVGNEDPTSHLISSCGTYFGSSDGDTYNAISQDGARVFFTALGRDAKRTCERLPPEVVEPAVNEVYARIDNGQQGAHTVAISEPTEMDCEECETSNPADALFRGASLDGLKVFFTTEQRLLKGAEGAGPFLYEYDFEAPKGRRVALISTGDKAGARVQGVARVSEDGSHVYFVAKGVLTHGEPNAYGEEPGEEAYNLYVSAQECPGGGAKCPGPTQQISFIGRLSESDKEDWQGEDIRPVQTTSVGSFLLFPSLADLTPDDTSSVRQVFEYNAGAKTLVRVSRGENSYNENGNSSLYPAEIPAANYSGLDSPTERLRQSMSANGAYVFFGSYDALTPAATSGYRNVYEYHDGTVALISGGHDPSVVEGQSGTSLLGTDESGHDVFFETADQLLQQDTDTQQDVYDARVDGGPPPTAIAGPCSGDSCQNPPSVAPSLLVPGMASMGVEANTPIAPVAPPKHKAKTGTKTKKAKRPVRKRGKRKAKRAAHGERGR